jgi:hypothetical protein
MSLISKVFATVMLVSAFLAVGCAPKGDAVANDRPGNKAVESAKSQNPAQPAEDGSIPSGTGVEKAKPADGMSNVQGKAFFNEKPAVGVQVKLCKTFSQYVGGCGGETFTAKTDEAGEYLIKDVPPGTYEGLTVQVFDTPFYVFATSGYVSAAKYNLESGKTYFAPDTHLFKNDLKLTSPKAGAKIPAENIVVSWEAYPDAIYYKYSIHGDTASGAETNYDYIGKRIDGTTVTLDKPLSPGTYIPRIESYGANDRRLSQSSQDIKFTVTGGAK